MEGPISAPPAARFTESVGWTCGRVSTTGRFTPVAADLVGGTAEQLRRVGHPLLTVELQAADDAGVAALRAVAADLRKRHRELVVL